MKLSYLFIIADIFICIGLIKYSYSIFLKLKDRNIQASNVYEKNVSQQSRKTVDIALKNYIFNLQTPIRRHVVNNEENLYVKWYGEKNKDFERIPLRIIGPFQEVLTINNINETEVSNRRLASYSRNKTFPIVKLRAARIHQTVKNRIMEKQVGMH